jgi:hypothetical protein
LKLPAVTAVTNVKYTLTELVLEFTITVSVMATVELVTVNVAGIADPVAAISVI